MNLNYIHLKEDDRKYICKIFKVVNSSFFKKLSRLLFPSQQVRDQRTVFMLWPHGGALGTGKQASQDLEEGLRPPCIGLLPKYCSLKRAVCEFVKWSYLLVLILGPAPNLNQLL